MATSNDIRLKPNCRFEWSDDLNVLDYREIGASVPTEKQFERKKKQNKKDAEYTGFRAYGFGRQNVQKVKIVEKGDVVTLDVIKDVASLLLEEEMQDSLPISFHSMKSSKQFDIFLTCLLKYFNCFFHRKQLIEGRNPLHIEPSLVEREQERRAEIDIEKAKRLVGESYSSIVIGLGMGVNHHMNRGNSRVSATYRDRTLFEVVYDFVNYAVWVVFKRVPSLELIAKQTGWLLRSNVFNPAIRRKHYNPDYVTEEENIINRETSSSSRQAPVAAPLSAAQIVAAATGRSSSPNFKHHFTEAEYRRQKEKRPPVATIVSKRSPAVSAMIPRPEEKSSYLFEGISKTGKTKMIPGATPRKKVPIQSTAVSNESTMAVPTNLPFQTTNEDIEDYAEEETEAFNPATILTFKFGLMGDLLEQYHPVTLMPKTAASAATVAPSRSSGGALTATSGNGGTGPVILTTSRTTNNNPAENQLLSGGLQESMLHQGLIQADFSANGPTAAAAAVAAGASFPPESTTADGRSRHDRSGISRATTEVSD